MKLVHPDLYESAPAQKAANSAALQTLNAFINSIRTPTSVQRAPYPPRQATVITFYVRLSSLAGPRLPTTEQIQKARYLSELTQQQHKRSSAGRGNAPMQVARAGANAAVYARILAKAPFDECRYECADEGEFRRISAVLTSSGGDCRWEVRRFFQTLFYQTNLPWDWQWDAEYWPEPEAEATEEEVAEAEAYARARARARAAGSEDAGDFENEEFSRRRDSRSGSAQDEQSRRTSQQRHQ
jgi:hypothetical protein